MSDFRFAFPLAFLLLLPAAFVLVRQWQGRWRAAPAVLRYSDTRLLRGLSAGSRLRLRRLPDALRLLAWLCLVVALARPQAGAAREILRGQGIDMVLAVDISDSMGTGDFAPYTRLDAAKQVLDAFIAGRSYDRIGLVVFAEAALYRAPPTLDYPLLRRILGDIAYASSIGLSNRTAIGVGLAAAASMLRESTAPSRVIIVLTDGANNAGLIDPLSAAQAAHALGIRVYTIGMGAPGPASDLDEDALRAVALAADGRYFNALQWQDLQTIYAEIDRLERSGVERLVTVRWQEQAAPWLLAALALLLLERGLRRTLFQTIP
ncbi:MAG: VWA domain-containing protein [Anaerolineae bacterium]|jgi:Ca-activated chloride channel family protein|nr:VWA domain-containing protein [Anaerolineae bacterium]